MLARPDHGLTVSQNPWGHSSVGRAVALQAIGLGFESPCLQIEKRSSMI